MTQLLPDGGAPTLLRAKRNGTRRRVETAVAGSHAMHRAEALQGTENCSDKETGNKPLHPVFDKGLLVCGSDLSLFCRRGHCFHRNVEVIPQKGGGFRMLG